MSYNAISHHIILVIMALASRRAPEVCRGHQRALEGAEGCERASKGHHPRGPQDLLRSREQTYKFRTIIEQNRGQKQIPCDALINLDNFSASDANSEPNFA